MNKAIKRDKANLTKAAKAASEGDVCIGCIESGYYTRRDREDSFWPSVIGAGAGLLGQYLGLRAYKGREDRAAEMAARLGHTYRPTPNFNLYAGLGLSSVATIGGFLNGSYMCGGDGMMHGGFYGMNNPLAMQMMMMGQPGAFGYNFGNPMMNPMGGMFMGGGMGPMGLHTPFHMMGQMHPAMMAGFGPYASMGMGGNAFMNPMLGLGILGGGGLHAGIGPGGMFSPYAMNSPFGPMSAFAGMGPLANTPWNMMNPGIFGSGGGIMSCIQPPCPGQLFDPFGMGGGIMGGGMMGMNPQALQMQTQMLQQQMQQQMAFLQQAQVQAQQRMQAAQQLTQLEQQMLQLGQQRNQLAAQAGVGGIIGGGFPGFGGGFGAGFGGGFGAGIGAGFGVQGVLPFVNGFMTGFPFTGSGVVGEFSNNTPSPFTRQPR